MNAANHLGNEDPVGLMDLDALIGHLDDEEDVGAFPRPPATMTPQSSNSSWKPTTIPRQPLLNLQNRPRPTGKGEQAAGVVKRRRKLGEFPHLKPVIEGIDHTNSKVFGFDTTADRKLDPSQVQSQIFLHGERHVCPLDKLMEVQPYNAEQLTEYATVCVLSRRGSTKISHKTNLPFKIWTVSDLRGSEQDMFLFGDAYNTFGSSVLEGDVIAVINPKLLFDETDDGLHFLKMSVSSRSQVAVIGKCAHFGRCKKMDCQKATNRSISPFCVKHAHEQLMVLSSNRMNINSSGGACFNADPSIPAINHEEKRPPPAKIKPMPLRVPLSAAAELLESVGGAKSKAAELNKSFVEKTAKQAPETMSAGQLKLAQSLKLIEPSRMPKGASAAPTMPMPPAAALSQPSPASSTAPLGKVTPSSSSSAAGSRAKNSRGKNKKIRLGSGLALNADSLSKNPSVNMLFASSEISESNSTSQTAKGRTKAAYKVPNYSRMMDPADRAKLSQSFRDAFAGVKPDDQ